MSNPTEKDDKRYFPKGAPVSGRVWLRCTVTETGAVADCTVAKDTAPGSGLAEVALQESSLFRFKPRDKDGKSVAGQKVILGQSYLAPGDRNPDWLRRPSPEDIAVVAPKRAIQAGVSGAATIRCRVTTEGYLDKCVTVSETPAGYGFGEAALLLSSQFAMKPAIRNGKPAEGQVTIPVNWSGWENSGITPGRAVIRDPVWRTAPSPEAVRAAFPARAEAIPAGQAALRCNLLPDGHVNRCNVTAQSPQLQGFGEAARKLAPDFVVALDPAQPAPKNTQIDIPFRFRNPTAPDDGRLTDVKWVQTLTDAGAQALFPQAARSAGVMAGLGILECVATSSGGLDACEVTREEPAGKGFGEAALTAATLLKMNPWTTAGDPVAGRHLGIPIRFKLESDASAGTAKP